MNKLDELIYSTLLEIKDEHTAEKMITMLEYESMVPNEAARRKAEIFESRIQKTEFGRTLRPMTKEEQEEWDRLVKEELEYYDKRNKFLLQKSSMLQTELVHQLRKETTLTEWLKLIKHSRPMICST